MSLTRGQFLFDRELESILARLGSSCPPRVHFGGVWGEDEEGGGLFVDGREDKINKQFKPERVSF